MRHHSLFSHMSSWFLLLTCSLSFFSLFFLLMCIRYAPRWSVWRAGQILCTTCRTPTPSGTGSILCCWLWWVDPSWYVHTHIKVYMDVNAQYLYTPLGLSWAIDRAGGNNKRADSRRFPSLRKLMELLLVAARLKIRRVYTTVGFFVIVYGIAK